MSDVNNNLVLIAGQTSTGKSASLMTLKDPGGVLYCNCEAGKELPFKSDFRKTTITNPMAIYTAFEKAESSAKIHTIVIDTITFLMDMFESQYVRTAADAYKAWADYGDFWRVLMQKYVAGSSKNVIMLAHTSEIHNESEGVVRTQVKLKGSVMNQGVEAYFCNVVETTKLPITKLENYKNPGLIITPEEEALGFKHVFQTKVTKETVHHAIRGPLGLWKTEETYINNDAQYVLDKLHKYYSEDSTDK